MANDKPAAAPEVQSSADLKSPDEWARLKGQFVEFKGVVDPELGNGSHFSWQHAAAATMHGWREHEHHESKPLLISEKDYLAALDAAAPKKGHPRRHEPAASKHAMKLADKA